MDLNKQVDRIIDIFKIGFRFNLDLNLKQDLVNTLAFCITLTILILGLPNDTFNGLTSWFFKAIYPQYTEMDLFKQLYYERSIWVQLKISLFMSLFIFSLTSVWTFIFYKVNNKAHFCSNVAHFFLYTYRWVYSIQLVAMLFMPFLLVKISYQHSLSIKEPIAITVIEGLCMLIIAVFFLLNFKYQAKRILDLIQAIPRKYYWLLREWYVNFKKKLAFSALVPLFGILIFSYFYNPIGAGGALNESLAIYNYCIYIKQNPNIPGWNGIKATLQEVGCKKYAACFDITDEHLISNCLNKLFATSEHFKFLAHNEKRNICRS